MENKTSVSQTIELSIVPIGPCNFKVPVATIPCEVYSNSNTPIIYLTKLDPEQDWGEFEWSFNLVDKNFGGYPPAVAMNNQNDYYMQDGGVEDYNNSGATADPNGTKACP